ncbi:hypothetical protein A8H39_01960 [Paraburkholderia fungorum]|uniref:hypothetical protein n=1 Tax=Paraburkholderia fungorum TaxID=134537 RepID=UPI000697CED6|nr:hypothetical protein [Paraburkholderia fungorum]PNE59937.1 hypothetical protein A8H39_01960 [Paraburkholderia fungorum]
MNQRTNEEKKTGCVPIIPLMFFPYPVKVIATDTCYPVDFEAKGFLYETGEVVIEYPFTNEKGIPPKSDDGSSAIDIHTIVLPNGEEMDRPAWEEIAQAPAYDRRLAVAIDMMGEAEFEYGEGEGAGTFDQTVQAKANVLKLVGLPYAYLPAQIGLKEEPEERLFEVPQTVLSVMMQDVVANYETPDQVPEWAWVEANAAYVHSRNGNDGVWEFTLNLSCTFEGDPGRLAPVIAAARAEGAAYLIIHQGT